MFHRSGGRGGAGPHAQPRNASATDETSGGRVGRAAVSTNIAAIFYPFSQLIFPF